MLKIREANASDSEAIWRIFHAVVARGDTYALDPATSREDALAYWLHAQNRCYVAESEGTILGTYIIKANQPGPGSHVANAAFMICHCQSCRRVAAAPVVAWITFPIAEFRLLRGHPSEFHSSEPVRRTFCAGCGTPLTYEHRDGGGFVDVTTCSLDDVNLFPPTHHS